MMEITIQLDRINGSAANSGQSILGQAAGTHPAQLTAHSGRTDIARRQVVGAGKGSA